MPIASLKTQHRKPTRTGVINIRVQLSDRDLIDQAADSQGKSRSDFMLDAARRAAEEALLERTIFRVDAATYERFVTLLDSPPQPNEQLRKLMQIKAPWD